MTIVLTISITVAVTLLAMLIEFVLFMMMTKRTGNMFSLVTSTLCRTMVFLSTGILGMFVVIIEAMVYAIMILV